MKIEQRLKGASIKQMTPQWLDDSYVFDLQKAKTFGIQIPSELHKKSRT